MIGNKVPFMTESKNNKTIFFVANKFNGSNQFTSLVEKN